MKILCITHYSSLYGANKSLINLLQGLQTYDVGALVVLPQTGDLCKVLEKKNIPYIIQNFNWWCGDRNLPYFQRKKSLSGLYGNYHENNLRKKENRIYLKELDKKIKNFQPDFVYSNSSVFNFGFLFSRKKNLPHIWHLRESQEQYFLKWFDKRKHVNKHFNQSEIVIAVSKFLKNYYQEKNKIQNIEVIYNGVLSSTELSFIDKRRKERKRKDDIVVLGLVGLIHPQKGQEEAIKAFARVHQNYPNTKLLIVGEGDYIALKKLSFTLKIDHKVEFWGHISNPFDAFLEMDISLMCSRMEGMGRTTLEAMAAGLPVIGYKEGGTKELIEDNITGLFYENDHIELAEKMMDLVNDEKKRLKMGQIGRREFEKKYTSEIYAKQFINLMLRHRK